MPPAPSTAYRHAAAVCADLERKTIDTIRTMQASLDEAKASCQAVIDNLNQGRAERGLPPLDL